MSLLFILSVLVLGYIYVQGVPSERLDLRRSAGWETYVRLGKYGLGFLIKAVVPLSLLYFAVCILLFLADWIFSSDFSGFFRGILAFNVVGGIRIYHLIIAVFAYLICESEIKSRRGESWEDRLPFYDGMLRVVAEAANTQQLVRVSLKSRKVYIGLITQEQSEPAESDNLVLIPVYSGYRDKDTLRMEINCRYAPVYQKYGILDGVGLDEDTLEKLDSFRVCIRCGEIESIVIFNDSLYGDFEGNPKL